MKVKSFLRSSVGMCIGAALMSSLAGSMARADSCDADGCESGPCEFGCYALLVIETGECYAGCADSDGNIIDMPSQQPAIDSTTDVGIHYASVKLKNIDQLMGLTARMRADIPRSRFGERISYRNKRLTVAEFLRSQGL